VDAGFPVKFDLVYAPKAISLLQQRKSFSSHGKAFWTG
jgi:hypothetical protein